jgi:replicative DNA helicase
VRSLEERTLQLLLGEPDAAAVAGHLPPPEAFLDPVARNIFVALARLYEQGARPEPRAVMASLSAETGSGGVGGAAIDRMAQLLLEDPVSARPGELGDSLRQLTRRFQQQRLRDLTREIREAQQSGDEARLESVLREKTRLSREIHQV